MEWLISTASQPLPLEATSVLTTPRMGASPVTALTDTSDLRDWAAWAMSTKPLSAELSFSLQTYKCDVPQQYGSRASDSS